MLRTIVLQDYLTILIIICLIILAISKRVFSIRFNLFLEVVFNSKYMKMYIKKPTLFHAFDVLLLINLIISASIYTVLIQRTLFDKHMLLNTMYVLNLALCIGVIIVVKFLIEKCLGFLFNITQIANLFVFQKMIFINSVGLVLLPINIISLYIFTTSAFYFYSAIGLLTVLSAISFVIFIKSNLNTIKDSLVYFILYLCALEIAPFIILYKVFMDY